MTDADLDRLDALAAENDDGEAWTIERNNDTGPDDEGFWEWYEVGPAKVDDRSEAEYFHAVQPAVIRQLIAEIRQLRAACKPME